MAQNAYIPRPQPTRRTIELFDTGEQIPEEMGVSREYLGTVLLDDGEYVLHAYRYTGV